MKLRALLLALLFVPFAAPPAAAQIPYTPVLDFSCDFYYYYGSDVDPRYDYNDFLYCEIANSNQHDITVDISMSTDLNMQLQDETVTVGAQSTDVVYVDFIRDRTTTKGAHEVELTAIITRYASVMTCDTCEEETRTKQVNIIAWFEMDWDLKEDPYEAIGNGGSQEVCPDNGNGDVVLEVSLDGNEGSSLSVSVTTDHELYSEHLDYDDDRIPEYDKGRDGELVIEVMDDGGTIEPGESGTVRIRMTFVGLPEEPALFRLNLYGRILVYPTALEGGSESCYSWYYYDYNDCYSLTYGCNTVENHGILDLIEEERQDFTDRLDEEQAESKLGHPGGSLFVLVALLGAALSSRGQRPRA
ncbi:MAG: hypothetical protein ACPGGI_05395 [Candidatus Poseidoniaceae archaeon]